MMGRAGWIRALALGALVPLFTTSPAQAGPPWLSIEYPANPHDRVTRDALMIVNTYRHGTPMQFPVSAVAEGVVDGQRRTIPLRVTRTPRTGAWAVSGDLPRGAWVVVATMTETGSTHRATLLAGLDAEGNLVGTRVPHRVQEGWRIPQEATRAEVEAMLRSTVAMSAASERSRSASAGWGLLLLVPAVVIGRGLRRRCGATGADAA